MKNSLLASKREIQSKANRAATDVKEVLVDYFCAPISILEECPQSACKKCTNQAAVFCPDCNMQLCAACSARAHHPTTFADKHSVEDLVLEADEKNYQIFTPMVKFALLIFVASFAWSRISIRPDYLVSSDMCPSIHYLQSNLATIDASLFYYFKSSLAFQCSVEDSFWKSILDVWVRTIVTESDSMLLLLTSMPQALMFQAVMSIVLLPVVALVFAFIVVASKVLDKLLSRLFPRHSKCGQFLQMVEVAVQFLSNLIAACNCFAYFHNWFFTSEADSEPPQTTWRRRENFDVLDGFWYSLGRKTRYFRWMFVHAKDTLSYAMSTMTISVIIFRMLCMRFNLAWIFRNMSFWILPTNTVAKHQEWFKHSSNILNQLAVPFWSTTFASLKNVISHLPSPLLFSLAAIAMIPCVTLGFNVVGNGFPSIELANVSNRRLMLGAALLLASVAPKLSFWIVALLLLLFAGFCSLVATIVSQRRAFNARWENQAVSKSCWATHQKDLPFMLDEAKKACQPLGQ